MRRVFCILLAVLCLSAGLPVFSDAASAPALCFAEKNRNGETIDISLVACGCVGVRSMNVEIRYDPDAVVFVRSFPGDDAQQVNRTENNGFNYGVNANEPGIIYFACYFKESLWTADAFAADAQPGYTVRVNGDAFELLVVRLGSKVDAPASFSLTGTVVYGLDQPDFTSTFPGALPPHVHEIVKVAAKAPTCTEEGWAAYEYCKTCDYTTKQTISAKGHTEVTDAAVAATCTTKGKTAGSHCSVCGTVIVAQTEIPAKGHTEVTDPAVAATCTNKGKTAGSHCSVCGTVIEAQTEIPAKGHTEVTDAAVAATCTNKGKTVGSHCSVCGTVIEAPTEIPAAGHVWDDGAVSMPPAAGKPGKMLYTCTVCGETKEEEIPAPAFIPGDVNGDGAVGADDARLALRRSVDLENYGPGTAAFLACDVNADGTVGADDARMILRASVDLETLAG